ncbi:hypothetical protein BH11PSE8_BH11PSE8_35710 [soil metagenome]
MTAPKAAVRFTANFESNLASIEAFWMAQEAPRGYELLLEELGQTAIGNLEEHPRIGRRFFARSVQSVEAKRRVEALQKRLGATEIREYLSGDYLLLYSVRPVVDASTLVVDLLAIRHHRQLSFDFESFWPRPPGDPTP